MELHGSSAARGGAPCSTDGVLRESRLLRSPRTEIDGRESLQETRGLQTGEYAGCTGPGQPRPRPRLHCGLRSGLDGGRRPQHGAALSVPLRVEPARRARL